MKKVILIAISSLIAGAAISPVLGMTLSPTRNLILGLAPEEAILALADKIDEQAIKNREQSEKMNELENINNQQKETLDKLSEAEEARRSEEEEQKKKECEVKLKNAQDSLADSQRHLGEDQEVLKLAEADKCNDCYTKCLKNNGCTKSGCDSDDVEERLDEIKKDCKKKHEENIGFRKQDVSGDLESIKRQEIKLQGIKNECNQSPNN